MDGNIVYAYVVADLLHVGHLIHLKNAKALAGLEGKLIVGVLTDEATMEKKQKPIVSFKDRLEVIGAIKYVDCAVAQEDYSPIKNIQTIKPDILIESSSHSEKDLAKINKTADSISCRVISLPYFPDQCSTQIKKNIKDNYRI
jgi:cytidyltransferase-like protein